jgi:hypothetical protein
MFRGYLSYLIHDNRINTFFMFKRLERCYYTICNIMIYLFTAICLKAGGSSTVHTYTQTIHRKTQ